VHADNGRLFFFPVCWPFPKDLFFDRPCLCSLARAFPFSSVPVFPGFGAFSCDNSPFLSDGSVLSVGEGFFYWLALSFVFFSSKPLLFLSDQARWGIFSAPCRPPCRSKNHTPSARPSPTCSDWLSVELRTTLSVACRAVLLGNRSPLSFLFSRPAWLSVFPSPVRTWLISMPPMKPFCIPLICNPPILINHTFPPLLERPSRVFLSYFFFSPSLVPLYSQSRYLLIIFCWFPTIFLPVLWDALEGPYDELSFLAPFLVVTTPHWDFSYGWACRVLSPLANEFVLWTPLFFGRDCRSRHTISQRVSLRP